MIKADAQAALQKLTDFVFERAGAEHVSKIAAHSFTHGYTAISVSEAVMALSEASSEEEKLAIVAAYCAPENTILAPSAGG